MLKLIALDVGDKRVGVAMGMLGPGVVRPLAIFERSQGKAEESILNLLKDNKIAEIIVGLPISEDGRANRQCAKIENFCRRLHKRLPLRVVFIDEYASSQEAQEKIANLKEASSPKGKEREKLDAIAACIIMETYFNNPNALVKIWDPEKKHEPKEL